MKYIVVALLLFWFPGISLAQATDDITGSDFVTNFREMPDKRVTISDCRIGGTDAQFIRCETANGSASYALDAKTMKRSDFKWALDNCPTGSRLKPRCSVRISGRVARFGMPRLEEATIQW